MRIIMSVWRTSTYVTRANIAFARPDLAVLFYLYPGRFVNCRPLRRPAGGSIVVRLLLLILVNVNLR